MESLNESPVLTMYTTRGGKNQKVDIQILFLSRDIQSRRFILVAAGVWASSTLSVSLIAAS